MADATATNGAEYNMAEGVHNPFVNGLLTNAQKLADEKDALSKKTTANREGLRNLKEQNLMSPEQAKAIDEFYPPVTRKPKDAAPAAPAAKPATATK